MLVIHKEINIDSIIKFLQMPDANLKNLDSISVERKQNHFLLAAEFMDEDEMLEHNGVVEEKRDDEADFVLNSGQEAIVSEATNENVQHQKEIKIPEPMNAKLQLGLTSYYHHAGESLCDIHWREAAFEGNRIKMKVTNEDIRFQVNHLLMADANPVLVGKIEFDQKGNERFYVNNFLENYRLPKAIIDPCLNCPASRQRD